MSKKELAPDDLELELGDLCKKYGITHFYFAHAKPVEGQDLDWGSTSNSHNGSLLEFLAEDQVDMWSAMVDNAFEAGRKMTGKVKILYKDGEVLGLKPGDIFEPLRPIKKISID